MKKFQVLKTAGRLLSFAAICATLLVAACAAPAVPTSGNAAQPPAPAAVPAEPTANSVPVAAAPTVAPPAATGLTEETLKNAEYKLPDVGIFRLKDGKFEYQYGSGATQVYRAGFSQAALGDLNNDGLGDAAAILSLNTGGSGTFIYVVAVVNGQNGPRQAAAELLGDRVQVQKLAVKDGQIAMDVKAFAPSDPMCCPSQLVTRSYKLNGEALQVLSEVRAAPAEPIVPASTAAAPAATSPASGLDAALAVVRFNPAAMRCDKEPVRTMTDQIWQANAVEEGGYGTAPAKPGQKVTVQLRNKLGDAKAEYQIKVSVVAPDGSATAATTTLKGNDLLRLEYPAAFAGAAQTTPGTYTVLYQVNGGFITCWGFQVK